MTTFEDIADVCQDWPRREIPKPDNASSLQTRIAQILCAVKDDPEESSKKPGDLIAMLRQLLRETSVNRKHPDLKLVVPNNNTPGWPSKAEWEAFNMTVRNADDQFRLTARDWVPKWPGADYLRDVYPPNIQDRDAEGPRCDPLIRQFELTHFKSESQAEAIRAAHLLPAGHTLVVNLPTGFGKSLLFQTVTIRAWQAHSAVSVIVVPTTALAKEQESRLQYLLGKVGDPQAATPIAYHADLSSADKQEFRDRIHRGKQPVIIASPESVLRALRIALTRQAERGALAWVVIDEVHMLSQWGEDFRSDFQLLATLIRQWRTAPRAHPEKAPRTLTLTATLSEDTLFTIRTLLAPSPPETDERFHVFVAAQLRQEPAYFMSKAPDEATKHSRVIDAVRHLPKPLIVYTVKVADAKMLYRKIQEETKISRVARFIGGDASTRTGTDNLRKWNHAELDIIVATSAFGLGMDNQDVRTVIHAGIPETVDRYYQEVGRGGRDGNRSLAVCIWSEHDRVAADLLATKTRIGLDKGWERWQGMKIAGTVNAARGTITVNVTHKPRNINADGDLNEAWNQRTLLLMAASELITVSCPELPEEETASIATLFHTYDIAEHQQLEEDTWRKRVHHERERAAARDEQSKQNRDQLLHCETPFNDVFANTYSVELNDKPLRPDSDGQQCPSTRVTAPHQVIPGSARLEWTASLLNHLPNNLALEQVVVDIDGRFIWVHYDPEQRKRHWNNQIRKLVQRLISRNFIEFAVPEELLSMLETDGSFDTFNKYLVLKRLDRVPPTAHTKSLPLPRVSIMGRGLTANEYQAQLQFLRVMPHPRHVVVFPSNLADPDQPDRAFQEAHYTHSLSHLLTVWGD
jgi:superfamily II DNA helicase RecQ